MHDLAAGGRTINIMETPTPDWTIWSAMPHAELWELSLLAMDVSPQREFVELVPLEDPRFVVPAAYPDFDAHKAQNIWKLARTRQAELEPVPGLDSFTIASFAQMMRKAGVPLPVQFPGSGTARGRWPWGDYTTPELDALAAAVKIFWCDFDPTSPDAAPTNDEVSDWLMKQHGLSSNTAVALASAMRDPRAPVGRRKKVVEKG